MAVCKKCGNFIDQKDEAYRDSEFNYVCSDCHVDIVVQEMEDRFVQVNLQEAKCS